MLQLTSVWVSPPSLVRQQQTKWWTHSPISLVWHFWDGLEQPRQALVVGGHVDGFPRHGGGVEPLTVHILLVQPGKSQVVAVTEVRENVFFQHCWQKRNPPPKTTNFMPTTFVLCVNMTTAMYQLLLCVVVVFWGEGQENASCMAKLAQLLHISFIFFPFDN